MTTDFSSARVLVLGGSGFVGSAIVRALVGAGAQVTATSYTRAPTLVPNVAWTRMDISDPVSVQQALAPGFDAIVHAISYTGRDPTRSARVNRRGPACLARALDAARPTRVVLVSTAAIYGSGPHRGPNEQSARIAPESRVSADRLGGETCLRQAGATIVRPNLIYGAGDRWFIPALIHLFDDLQARIEAGAARISIIAVEDLGRLVTRLALHGPPDSTFHAAHPLPITISDILAHLHEQVGTSLYEHSIDFETARGRTSGSISAHQLALIAWDNYYDAASIWRTTGCRVPPSPFVLSDQHLSWYASRVLRAP